MARFLEKVKKYIDITELAPELLTIFIEKIEIYEKPEKFKHNQLRQIDIHYRDVGLLDYVNGYNNKRIYSSLGYVTPCEYTSSTG